MGVLFRGPIMVEATRFQDARNLILPFNEDFFPIIPVSVVLYLAVIGGLWFMMKNRKAIEGPGMSRAIAIHNFILCGFSLICFSGQLYEAIHILRHFSPFQLSAALLLMSRISAWHNGAWLSTSPSTTSFLILC